MIGAATGCTIIVPADFDLSLVLLTIALTGSIGCAGVVSPASNLLVIMPETEASINGLWLFQTYKNEFFLSLIL